MVETETIETIQGDADAGNFYVIDFKYQEPVVGQVVWTAKSEEDAVAELKSAVPPEVTGFEVASVKLVDPSSEEYAQFKAALDASKKQLN